MLQRIVVPLVLAVLLVPTLALRAEASTLPTHAVTSCQYAGAIRAAFARAGAPRYVQSRMVAIAWRESKCRPQALRVTRHEHSLSLFQINMKAWGSYLRQKGYSYSYLRTAGGNIKAAVLIYKRCGLGPWTKPYWCRRP